MSTTQSKFIGSDKPNDSATYSPSDLRLFVEEVAGEGSFRIEKDYGGGFVRLKTSEAERRQAAQDIGTVEDIVIELLRNSRDAGSKNVFLATKTEGNKRFLTVIDDGCGIPKEMHENVFLPRVTSKLDTAKRDRWGFHGRGMALYSIKVNSESSEVVESIPDLGTAINVAVDLDSVPEKKDQSTFPAFEAVDGVYSMRGPKNILRTAAEFAMENRGELAVYLGTPTEIAATLYSHVLSALPASARLFGEQVALETVFDRLGFAKTPEELSDFSCGLGLDISARSARRIMDGEIGPVPSMMARIERESFGSKDISRESEMGQNALHAEAASSHHSGIKISDADLEELSRSVSQLFDRIADGYYLESVEPKITQRSGRLTIQFDLVDVDDICH